jgi:hypothetical protein
MRFPNRIPASNAMSPTAPARVLVPVETLPAKPQTEKNKKVFSPNDPNFRSDKRQANLTFARCVPTCGPAASQTPKIAKAEKVKTRNEVNLTSDKYGANPTLPRLTPDYQ